MCLKLLPWTCLHGHVPLLSLLSRGKHSIAGLRQVPRKHPGTRSAVLLSGVKIYHVLRSSLNSLIIESRQIHSCAGTASSSQPHSSVLSIINKTALLARHWLLFSVQGLGEESQHNIPLSLSHPLPLRCSRGITCSAGPFYVSTLLLFSQQKEHLHRTPSPSLLLSASCAWQAVHSLPREPAAALTHPVLLQQRWDGFGLLHLWPCHMLCALWWSELSWCSPAACRDRAVHPCPSVGLLVLFQCWLAWKDQGMWEALGTLFNWT